MRNIFASIMSTDPKIEMSISTGKFPDGLSITVKSLTLCSLLDILLWTYSH